MGEYAKAGVDYKNLQPFKDLMVEMGKRTLAFPNARGVYVDEDVVHAHGAVWEYRGALPHKFVQTTEGLGNKNWIAEWMYMYTQDPIYFESVGIDTVLMAAGDAMAQGGMPVIYTDEIAVGDDNWFTDPVRNAAVVESFFRGCEMVGAALPAGETPALRYLIRSESPVLACPSLSGTVTALIAPGSRMVTGTKLAAGDLIVGVPSSGIHANGISLLIKRALGLEDQFFTKLPNGHTLGYEALIPTRNYLGFVEALLGGGIDVHTFLPATGDGVAKLAFDKHPFTYEVFDWPSEAEIPELFLYMRELGVSQEDCLKTFNWGMGYYAFVAEADANTALDLAEAAGFGDAMIVGRVVEGDRKVIFEPAGITLPPPGE